MSQGAPALQTIGRYKLLGELGRGAMGVVYRAEDPNIGRMVALKTQRLDVQGEESEELLRRLRQEARSAGILNHPNIVTIYDAGEQDALFYIAMEYIEGTTLQSMLSGGRVLPVEQVVEIARQICAGLDYAHARSIVHRDIKPANIMITPEGAAKIMDFGIAKTGSGMTSAGAVLGTPSYMSPEQVKGKALDGRSDLFSVGVILYEAVTGQKPFTGDSITTIIYKIVNEDPLAPRDIDLSVHPGLDKVITRALCKNLEQRYQRGWDLARDLMNYKSLAATLPAAESDSDSTVAMSAEQLRAQAAAASLPRKVAPAGPGEATAGAAAAPAPARQEADQPAKAPAGAVRSAPPAAGMSRTTMGLAAAVVVLLLIVGIESRVVWRARHAQEQTAATTQAATSSANPAASAPAATTANATPPPAPENALTSPSDAGPAASTEELKTSEKRAAKPATKRENAPAAVPAGAPVVAVALTGQLRVLSSPSGAEITLDGKPSGLTPQVFPEMAPGAHTLTVAKAGYRPETRNVEVERGKRAQVNAILISNMASVSASSTPAGASVLIDGNDTGKLTPAQVQVSEGSHKVTLKLQGWHTAETTVKLKPGESYNFGPTLTRDNTKPFGFFRKVFGPSDPENKGTLIIRTHPAGATVLLNGTEMGKKTPIPRAQMNPGKYHVTIKMPGYRTMERDVTIEKGKVVDLSGPLEKQ